MSKAAETNVIAAAGAVGSPPKDSVPEAALTRWLRELPNYVVLRNEEDLFGNLRRGGDVDMLVADPESAARSLIGHLGPPVRITRRSYVAEYFYDWGSVDLLPSIEWRGGCYLRTEAVLEGRQISERGRPVPSRAHEAVISWLTSLLWGGFFKERYAAVIRQAVEADGEAFRRALLEAAGKRWGGRLWQAAVAGRPEMSAEWTTSLRQAIWWRACFRSPVRTLQRFFAFAIGELRLRFKPSVPWIAILGSDGSGKSTIVKEVVHRFTACPYATVKAFHWRPGLIARPRDGGEPVTDPHGQPCRGPIGSVLSLIVLTADWLVGYWTRLAHLRAKGYILAFDRMYFDLVVDHRRYRYGGGPRLARALWWLLPKPDLVFLLDSEPGVLWHRKQEVPVSELARQRHAYRELARQLPAGHVLNGSLPVSVLVDDIQRLIRAWMLERSVASLGGTQAAAMPIPTANADGSRDAPTC